MKPAFIYAVLIHAAFFTVGDTVLIRPPQYGVEAGGIEVNLVAAVSREEWVQSPAADEPAVSEAPKPPQSQAGDGSSPVPGQDSTTLQSVAGAWTEASPSYLKNPPPRYPESARSRGEEGTVWMLVQISKEGRALAVKVKKSSGFAELDQAALEAIERWKFLPARIGAITIESQVQIPVRFELD
ncbi:MAG: TonB family protein [Candidatus Omnitrophica bacterium]|nr:TonB family protein [Candidatus Omnitrophota bacterium]